MLTWALAQSFLFIGDVDHIAPVTGGAFLLMFACCNMACFVQTVAVRSFQPKFRWHSRWTALLAEISTDLRRQWRDRGLRDQERLIR